MKNRDRDRQTDRQTDRLIDRQTETDRDRVREREREREGERRKTDGERQGQRKRERVGGGGGGGAKEGGGDRKEGDKDLHFDSVSRTCERTPAVAVNSITKSTDVNCRAKQQDDFQPQSFPSVPQCFCQVTLHATQTAKRPSIKLPDDIQVRKSTALVQSQGDECEHLGPVSWRPTTAK